MTRAEATGGWMSGATPPIVVPLQLEVVTDLWQLLQLEFSGSQISQRAVQPGLIVINPPVLDDLSGLVKAHEPVLVQTFVAEPAVETLPVTVIDGFPVRMN